MQQSTNRKTNASKSIPKSTAQKSMVSKKPGQGSSNNKNQPPKYKIDAITRDNFDVSTRKENIT